MPDFRVDEGLFGKRFVPKGRWTSGMTEFCLSNGITDVYANIAFGWPGYSLSFVEDLPELLGLEVLTDRVEDLPVIECLTRLRSLSLSLTITERIDFSCFPDLEQVHLGWNPKARSVFACARLRKILMTSYRSGDGDLSAFCSLPNLESLRLKVCNVRSIGDLSCLARLRELEISLATKLQSLDGIEELRSLRELEVHTCRRITRIDPIGQLHDLERLLLPNNGKIASIRPLRSLKRLREFFFYDSTNILDGDLTPLRGLPNLRDVAFAQRRHYNLRREDLPGDH